MKYHEHFLPTMVAMTIVAFFSATPCTHAFTGLVKKGPISMKLSSMSSLSVEAGLNKRGFRYVIGSDESGRGSIAGPVVAASCCVLADLSTYEPIDAVNDSKALSKGDRERIYETIMSQPDVYAWRVAERSHFQIDESNILTSTMECFRDSIESLVAKNNLPLDNTYSIVDGKKTPKLTKPGSFPCRPWVRGDAEVYTVALASIIAKVTRDKIMTEFHDQYPEYGFDVHKGYGTREHVLAVHKYGSSPIHRMSFKQVKGR